MYNNILQMQCSSSLNNRVAVEKRENGTLTCEWTYGKPHVFKLDGEVISSVSAAWWMFDGRRS